MASKKAVMATLMHLGRVFAGKVDEDKASVYAMALDDVEDPELAEATAVLVKSHSGEFIPTPAAIRAVVPRLRPPRLDVERILRQIERMGEYVSGEVGWVSPSVARVRELAGDLIADAYADVGPSRLASDDSRTREFARGEFGRALRTEAARAPHTLPTWATPQRISGTGARRLLGPGGESVAGEKATGPDGTQ